MLRHLRPSLNASKNNTSCNDWICELVTNATFFVNRILQHSVGCVGISLPARFKGNRTIIGLEKNHMSVPYVDNLCLFRCLGLHLSHDAMTIYTQYTDQPAGEFEGVTIDDLQKVENVFGVNIVVYELGEVSAQLVRRSLRKHADTMYVNLHETHFSYIRDIKAYTKSYRCRKCGDSLWKRPSRLEAHETTCEGDTRRIYNGGVYHPTP